MGLFKTIITHVVATRAEEALMEKIAEELPSEDKAKARKTPLFKSRRELAEAAAIYFFSVQSFYIMILMMCQIDDMSWGGFYRTCAMASLVAWAMLFVGIVSGRFTPVTIYACPTGISSCAHYDPSWL